MSVDPMILVTVALAVLSAGNAWVLVVIKSLQRTDAVTAEKVAQLEVLVAASYLTRTEFQSTMTTQTNNIIRAIEKSEERVGKIEERFVRIEERISHKQDR